MSPIEEELYKKVQEGKLKIEMPHISVWVWHGGFRRWFLKTPDAHPVSGRLRFRFGPKRNTVYRNRLVYLAFHGKILPGYVVDHIDKNRLNDHPDNLCLMRKEDSYVQGNSCQADLVLEELSDFFQVMGNTYSWGDVEA